VVLWVSFACIIIQQLWIILLFGRTSTVALVACEKCSRNKDIVLWIPLYNNKQYNSAINTNGMVNKKLCMQEASLVIFLQLWTND
jgi:hypothetical protein